MKRSVTVPNTGTVIPQTEMCNIQRFTAAAAMPSAGSSPKKLGVWKYFYYENGKAKWSLQSYLSWIGGDFE